MSNNDYILRSDAINALTVSAMLRNLDSVEDGPAHMYKRAAERIIAGVPAADVEPKRKSGRWIIAGAFDDFYQCPECGEMWPIFSTIEWMCCPTCECKIITNRPKGEYDG